MPAWISLILDYIYIYILIVISYLSRKPDLFVVVAQSLSCMQLSGTAWTAAL